jgi:fructan beta-fructosidase
MVYYDGEYHLYYQYNPYGSRWGNMHWGHAVSEDLVSWEHIPFALAPDSLGTIFSGSAVIDEKNTSGFGKDALVAIYTSAGRSQTQSIAYSSDRGRTFTKYDGNPILSDLKYPDFRDPKVIWHEESSKWIMALATGQTITFYSSEDLKEWDRLSEFGEGIGSHDGVWECPDLFTLDFNGATKWILIVSINPGGPNGGSATQYFIGDFDGTNFIPDNLPYPIWLDYGRDNYAGVTWSNIDESDGRRLFIGWMSNWDYANDVPQVNFRGAMTLPRELKLVHNGNHLIVANPPVEEVNSLRGEVRQIDMFTVEETYEIEKLTNENNGTFELEMNVDTGSSEYFTLELRNDKEEKIIFNFDLENGIFSVDRSLSGIVDFNNNFANKNSEAAMLKKKSYDIRLFVDKASTEIFIDNGEIVQTNIMFPTEPYNSLVFESEGEIKINKLNIYPIR